MSWRTVSDEHSPHSYGGEEARLLAYQRVFNGSPSKDDQQIVLADLMARSGFNQITDPTVSANEMFFREGKRAMFAEIFSPLTMGVKDLEDLSIASRREAALRTVGS